MIEPIKVGETFKLLLHSQNATMRTENIFNFDVNLKDIEGDVVRCAVSKVRYPAPATYIPRRIWLASGHIWLKSHLDLVTPPRQPNDYDNLLAKYGLNNWFYLYYPTLNLYIRMQLRDTASVQIRQVTFAVSQDGVNWVAGAMASFGLQEWVHFSAGALVPFDCIEIDTVTPQFSKALPSSYIQRRMWFAGSNTWKPSTTPVGQLNSYDALFAKYNINTWIYFYYPFRNQYIRIRFNSAESASIRNTSFAISTDDGINWTPAGTTANMPNWVSGTDFSGNPDVGINLFEIDMNSLPFGTLMQNIHCPELRPSMSHDTTTKDTTDIIGNIVRDANGNPFVVNDNTYQIKEEEICHELSGNGLRAMRNINVSFSRVATPTVREAVTMPWFVEVDLFKVA